MMPMKKKAADISALDSLMDSEGAEDASVEPVEAKVDAKAPKEDPATVIASIQSQLDELSSMLQSMG